MEALKPEIERRQSNTAKVVELFRSKPNQWISWSDFAYLVGERAYRTRISNAKKLFEAEGGTVESLTRVVPPRILTEYRYWPVKPLGPSADVPHPSIGSDGPFSPKGQLSFL